MGRGSVGVRSPLSSGTARCICGGYGRKVTRLTLGDLRACLVLGLREGVRWARRSQQRAEGSSQRPEARTREPGPMPWSRVPTEAQSWELRRPNDPGRRRPEVAIAGTRASNGTGEHGPDRTTDPDVALNSGICSGALEPPCTEPYARWCGRTGGVTLPPTRSWRPSRWRRCSWTGRGSRRWSATRDITAQSGPDAEGG